MVAWLRLSEKNTEGLQELYFFEFKKDFPPVGLVNCLYIETSENLFYYWNGKEYILILASSGDGTIGGYRSLWSKNQF